MTAPSLDIARDTAREENPWARAWRRLRRRRGAMVALCVVVIFILLAVFAPLIAWAVWIGVYPKPYFDILEKPVAQLVERVRPGYYAAHPAQPPPAVPATAGHREGGAQ